MKFAFYDYATRKTIAVFIVNENDIESLTEKDV